MSKSSQSKALRGNLNRTSELRLEPTVLTPNGIRGATEEETRQFALGDAAFRRDQAKLKREGVAAAKLRMKSLFEEHGFTHRDLRRVRLVLHKRIRFLELYVGDTLLKTYRVGLGGDPEGPKRWMGDKRTPEGKYYIGG